uniref:Retrovirus-related Pol polyprotein from transposon 17.6 n=1 Tax=Tanacetum cinerariifolium TaxID=118510 RepID=A0A6L2LGA3_TANCI|nr:retrovirus-related Pol polyprotein from transposon 17.6 [Tanacetum cinerariifolium]
MEYLVNISKRRAFWSLNEDILKITVLSFNMPYPSRKIRSIHACIHQRPQRKQAQYAVSRKDSYAVLEIRNEYNIMKDIKHGPYSKKPQNTVSNPLDTSIHAEDPHTIDHDKPVESDVVLTNDQPQEATEPLAQPSNKTLMPPIPFPQRLRKEQEEAQHKKFLEDLRHLYINLPFIKALAQMPKYAKFLKGLLINKARLKQACTITMNERAGKSIDQSDQDECEPVECNNHNKSDKSIWCIECINTPNSVHQETAKPVELEKEHLYSASTNEIDEKKPKLEYLPNHLEYAYLYSDKSFPIIISSKLSDKEKSSLLQVLEKQKGAIPWKMSDIKGSQDGEFALIIANLMMQLERINFLFPLSIRCWNVYAGINTTDFLIDSLDSFKFQSPLKRCMTSIFHDMVDDFMEVFMDDFSVFGNSFDCCIANLDRMLAICEETNLVLNWEEVHFMVKEGIVLGHKISGAGIEVDRAKIDDAKPRLIRWVLLLQGFDIEIKDKRGAENLAANHL